MSSVTERVSKIVKHWCDPALAGDVRAETELESLELDSLNVEEICIGLEQEFEIELDAKMFSTAKTIADVAAIVESAPRREAEVS